MVSLALSGEVTVSKKCPICGIELPCFNKHGNHNFCPASTSKGKIINICMNCKMETIIRKWNIQDWFFDAPSFLIGGCVCSENALNAK